MISKVFCTEVIPCSLQLMGRTITKKTNQMQDRKTSVNNSFFKKSKKVKRKNGYHFTTLSDMEDTRSIPHIMKWLVWKEFSREFSNRFVEQF